MRVREWYGGRRFQVLFGLLLLTLVGSPLVRAGGFEGRGLEAFVLVSLAAAGLGRLGAGRGLGIAALLLLFGAARALRAVRGDAAIATPDELLLAFAALLAGAAALREALRRGSVTRERLYAASSVYLLAGLAFALTYHWLERVQPGSLRGSGGAGGPFDLDDAVYFSFVTLATLGYGDVVPVTPVARSLAIVEAVGAQLFVAVLIARLVSLQTRSD